MHINATREFPAVAVFALLVLGLVISCKQEKRDEAKEARNEYKKLAAEVADASNAAAKGADIPLLPLTKGDYWIYQVKLQIPAGAKSQNSAAETVELQSKRTYIGKVKPGADYPETGCFEIEAEGNPPEREFADIDDEQFLLRGSALGGSSAMRPFWLDPGVLLVRAGLRGGEMLPPVKYRDPATGATHVRVIQVIGREPVTTAVRTFDTIRILMTGNDGAKQSRRTIWFAPHFGIVKEENARYENDKLVLKQTLELEAMQLMHLQADKSQ